MQHPAEVSSVPTRSMGAAARTARARLARLPRLERVLVVVGSVAVLGSFALRLWTIGQPLIEAHAFRQTQTAYTAVLYHRNGIDLLHTPLPVLGPPWQIPYEFPLFQAIGAMVIGLGVPTEIALRSTSLFFFVVSAGLLWAIVSLEIDRRTAALASVAFLLAPLGILWSRTSMVETIAVAAVLGSLFEALRWDRGGSRVHLAAAFALAGLAAMLKITTAAIWLGPAIFLLRRSRLASIGLVATAALVGLVWTNYADGIKAASPATAWLTSAGLRDWNFGTIAQRLDLATWRVIFLRWLPGLGLVVFLSPFVIRRSRIGMWALATLLLGPLVFTNLFVVHDYYWMAVGPAAAILIGMVVERALRVSAPGRRVAAVAALAGIFALSFYVYPRWILMIRPRAGVAVLERAAQIAAVTTPDDLVAIDGYGWSPELLFYADRYGYMEDDRVPPAPAGYVHFHCSHGSKGVCTRD